jgi:pimeloyl-ACP methyl ester carboxylesterase
LPLTAATPHLYYEDRGAGEPLLAIVGFAASSAVLEPLAAPYGARFRYITYDHPGTCRSSKRSLPVTTAHLAASAARLLDELGIESAHVIGHSLGGAVAQELALRFPHRVRGLILVGTSTSGPLSVPVDPRDLARVAVHGLRPAIFSADFLEREPERADALMRALTAHRAPPWSIAGQFLAAGLHDRALDLHRVTAPSLILHGERDRLVPVANARRLAAAIPDAELHVIEGTGHSAELERRDEVLAIVCDWLARRAPAAGPQPAAAAVVGERLTRELAVPLGALRVAHSSVVLVGRALRTAATSGTRAFAAAPKARSRTPRAPGPARRASSRGG